MIKNHRFWFSEARISHVWGIPLLKSEDVLLESMRQLDPDYGTNIWASSLNPDGFYPLYGFEIEHNIGRGGRWEHVLANAYYLEKYCQYGVIIVFEEKYVDKLKEMLDTLGYRSVIPVLADDILRFCQSLQLSGTTKNPQSSESK